jgi:hypothetical protein
VETAEFERPKPCLPAGRLKVRVALIPGYACEGYHQCRALRRAARDSTR